MLLILPFPTMLNDTVAKEKEGLSGRIFLKVARTYVVGAHGIHIFPIHGDVATSVWCMFRMFQSGKGGDMDVPPPTHGSGGRLLVHIHYITRNNPTSNLYLYQPVLHPSFLTFFTNILSTTFSSHSHPLFSKALHTYFSEMAPVGTATTAIKTRPVISRAAVSRTVRHTKRTVPLLLRRPKALPVQLITVTGVVAMCLALVHAYDRSTPRTLPKHRQPRKL